MQEQWGAERFVDCSGHIALECEGCGESLFLLGQEEDWYTEGRTVFECQCGKELTLADRAFDTEDLALLEGFDNGSRSVRDLIRGLKEQNTDGR